MPQHRDTHTTPARRPFNDKNLEVVAVSLSHLESHPREFPELHAKVAGEHAVGAASTEPVLDRFDITPVSSHSQIPSSAPQVPQNIPTSAAQMPRRAYDAQPIPQ